MESSRVLLFFFYSILIHFVKPTSVQRDPYNTLHDCYGNVTSNSTYRANLNNLLSSLSSKTQMVNGFYNFSAGENSDEVNAIAFCRPDQTPAECGICVNISAHELLQLCPNQKEGIIWYANCTVRYSDRFIFGRNESQPMQVLLNSASTSDRILYNDPLSTFLNRIRKEASGRFAKFANGTFKVQNSLDTQDLTVHALMQCTPDLAERDCDDCLLHAQDYITTCCNETVGARVLTPSCNLDMRTAVSSMAMMNPHHHYLLLLFLLLLLLLRLQKERRVNHFKLSSSV